MKQFSVSPCGFCLNILSLIFVFSISFSNVCLMLTRLEGYFASVLDKSVLSDYTGGFTLHSKCIECM